MTRCTTAAARCRGFTLFELLVVMLIMGLMVGLVSAIVRPDDRGMLHLEAERLAQLLDLAVAESRLAGLPVAWTADGRSYRFWRMSGDAEWSEIRDNDLLRVRTLPPEMVIARLQVENATVHGAMRLVFSPYGLTQAFTIEMALGAARCVVAASPIGEVGVLTDDGQSGCAMAPQ